MQEVLFNYYNANIKDSTPAGVISLDEMIRAIRSPKKNIEEVFNLISIAEQNHDNTTKQRLKSKLYYFTPCVLVENGTRKYINISSFTGLLALDFDHLEPDYAEEFKKALFDEYKFIIASWLSASRHGVKCLVNIPICNNVDEFKERFSAIEDIMDLYHGFDPAPKNCILPLFLSYDKNLLFRNDAILFTKRKKIIVSPPVKQYIISDKTSICEKIIYKKLQKITDNGHYILRAAAYLMGGYVGAGHIDRLTALTSIENMIDAHWYLSQKSSIYKRTAKDMIDKGILSPAFLK